MSHQDSNQPTTSGNGMGVNGQQGNTHNGNRSNNDNRGGYSNNHGRYNNNRGGYSNTGRGGYNGGGYHNSRSNYNNYPNNSGNQRQHDEPHTHGYKFPPCSIEEIYRSIRPPRLSGPPTADTIMPSDAPKTKFHSGDPRYRPNVAAHIFNEKGEFLGCFRKDGKSWQCVQGGIEGDDDDLEQAALRELEEEVGLTPASGLVYVGEIYAPSVSELRSLRGSSDPPADGAPIAPPKSGSDSVEPDWTYFRYELPWYAGKRIREQGYIGQEQRQLLFYLPSKGIDSVELQPDPAKFGPDVKREFKRVAWMEMGQFYPLVASHKSHIFAYVFYKSQSMMDAFLVKLPAPIAAVVDTPGAVATESSSTPNDTPVATADEVVEVVSTTVDDVADSTIPPQQT